MSNPKYAAYLESSHWIEFRLSVLKKKSRCSNCGISRILCRFLYGSDLELHHLHYRTLGREAMGDVLVLCRGCHEVEEQYKISSARVPYSKVIFHGWPERRVTCPFCGSTAVIGVPCTPLDTSGRYRVASPEIIEGCDCDEFPRVEELVDRLSRQVN